MKELRSEARAPEWTKEGNIELGSYVGIDFGEKNGVAWWHIECPCGVTVGYRINELPVVDTPHPCGNPTHWTVKFYDDTP